MFTLCLHCSECLSDRFAYPQVAPCLRAALFCMTCRGTRTSWRLNFEAPLKEFVRMVKSAKSVMQDRSTALTTLQQVRCKTWLLLLV